jgi:hypothetical protein
MMNPLEHQPPGPPTLRTGKLCYLEIPARDVHQSAAFYEQAFGWTIRQGDTDRPSFDDTTGEVSGAWVTSRVPVSDADTNSGILPYIMVADAAQAAQRLVAAGGVMVLAVGTYGTEVVGTFRDPAGNLMGIYQQAGLGHTER